MKKVGIALLGLGTVGGGTYKILEKNHEDFQKVRRARYRSPARA